MPPRRARRPTAASVQPLVDKLGVSAPDDTTLVFKLASPQPVFTQILSLWGMAPLKQSVIEAGGANWWQSPKNHVTNGAWVLDSFTSNQNVVFKPNPNYTGEKPYLTQVEAKIIKDAGADLDGVPEQRTGPHQRADRQPPAGARRPELQEPNPARAATDHLRALLQQQGRALQ